MNSMETLANIILQKMIICQTFLQNTFQLKYLAD